MAYYQAKFFSCKELLEDLEDKLIYDFGAISVTILDAKDEPILELGVGEYAVWSENILQALFDEEPDKANLENLCVSGEVTLIAVEKVVDKVWEREWMKDFRPMQFGKNLWICPNGFDAPEPDAVNIMLDPGLAFGTGTHPTTALCLEWLDGVDLKDKIVIDYGCGSGILAIAALLFGARKCYAIDNDPQALIATMDNAVKNNVEQNLIASLPEDFDKTKGDILLANILAKPLLELAPLFSECCKVSSNLVLSGILKEQEELIINGYSGFFDKFEVRQMEDWLRVSALKSS